MGEHTKLPWTVSPARTVENTAMIVGGDGFEFGLVADVIEDADAAFIVKAVNSHETLVEALEDLLSDAERQMKNPSHHQPFSYQKAKDALARVNALVAGGREP